MILAPESAGDATVASLPESAASGTSEPAPAPTAPTGLYVHVPFCVSICPYCDFVVYAGKAARGPERRIQRFLAALEVELRLRADALDRRWGTPGARPPLETLYLGGGTPSLLSGAELAGLIALVADRFGLADGAEVTLEANPGADERGDPSAIRAAGVTRLSIGAQSFDPAELRALGRRHAPADVATTVRAARCAGIDSISIDLLYDIPGQAIEVWARTLDAAIALEPDHVSLYALTLDDPDAEGITGPRGDHLPLRRGARRWRDEARRGQDEDRAAAMYELADERVAAAGLGWYEISNWARPGHVSRHNLGYWQGRAWEALGPGAHAFDGERRRWNAAPLDGYLTTLLPGDGSPGQPPPGGTEPWLAGDGEAAMLALRTSDGLPAHALARPELRSGLAWAIHEGLVERVLQPVAEPVADRDRDRLVLTLRGRLLSNEVFARLV